VTKIYSQKSKIEFQALNCYSGKTAKKIFQRFAVSKRTIRGGATRGTGGTIPLLLTKVIFVNRLKPMRKYWRYGGGGGGHVTHHT